jgi:hypothetical protein
MLRLPFWDELEKAENVLLAGAGGGFDIFCGLPLYFALKSAGKNVHLANLSFSMLPPPGTGAKERLSPSMLEVTADTPLFTNYFPELLLAQWFRTQGEATSIYCFEGTGVKPLHASYQTLAEHLQLDTVVLIDGGTDSLMRGDEAGVGTPEEDIASILAVNELDIARKLLVSVGFGVDHFHGVCHAHFLEAVAELTRKQSYLGMFSLHEDMPEVLKYRRVCRAVFHAMPHHVSIVSSSILSALAGHYGDHHETERTKHSTLWINPLMPVYWCFRLQQVAERILYPATIKETESYAELTRIIEVFRYEQDLLRPYEPIVV